MTAQDQQPPQRHILVIDRDWLVLAALSEGLRGAGYRVTPSADGEDALAIAARDAPDLALLDTQIRDMNGTKVGNRLCEAGVPFLCRTLTENRGAPGPAAEPGAYGYLGTTLDIQKIVPSIETALARVTEIRQLRDKAAQLTAALTDSREINMAAGMLMMRDRLNREEAFETLRCSARSQRRTISEVAREMLEAVENLHSVSKLQQGSQPALP